MILLGAALAAAALATAPAPAESPFSPGEETVMDVRYLGVHSGEGRLLVGQAAGDVWPLILQLRTDGVAALFDIREHLVSYWDSALRQTRGFDLRSYEVGEFKMERTRFDRANGKVTYERQRKGKSTHKTLDVPRDVHDLTSATMWLRLQRLEPGDRHALPVCTGSRQFTLVAEVLGRERVATPIGAFEAVKVRVRTAFEGKFSTKRDTFVWFSDDARHMLVHMTAEFAVGSLVATVKSYRPGDRVAQVP